MNAPVSSDLAALSMTEAADAFARGEIKAEAMVRACLARIDAHDAKVNSVIRLDREAALEAAAAQDKARAAGAVPGKLAGAPMMHKDMYYREGRVTTCGSAIRKDFVAPRTATVLERLDAAGAIDMGTLNMAEFAQNPTGHNAHFGHCHNPWNLPYCTGGSSSGSGAGVAARFFTAALGSDTGGSIRLPATICGVTGIKATQTRVSRSGVMPLSFSMDNVGPLTRTARDAARFMTVIAGHDPKDPTASREPVPDYEAALTGNIKGKRVVVLETMFLDGADEPVASAFEEAMRVLAAQGAIVTRITAPEIMRAVNAYTAVVSRVEGATIHGSWMRGRAAEYAVHLSARLFGGYAIPGHYYVEALSRRGPLLRRFVAEVMGEADLVATPTLKTRVPTLAETDIDADPENWSRFMAVSFNTRPFNYLGLPTVSIPCGFDDRGLPIGLQLAGRPYAEGTVLRAADAFQRVTDWHSRAPAL
jgi:aspartyl-tRNA(Asn)/glutamyl-tRNA(Gln) amidotransferase subunit A